MRDSWVRGEGQVRKLKTAFTLIEMLVAVAIITLLVSILLPSFVKARAQSQGSVCLSNLKQIGTGLTMYVLTNRDRYPEHSSPSSVSPRTRWPDYLRRQMRSEDVYNCPSLSPLQRLHFSKEWAHNPGRKYGGYGYNFQYLGNSRTGTSLPEWRQPYYAMATAIRKPSLMLAIADTRGSRKGVAENAFGQNGNAVYVIDPPLGSKEFGSKGARQKDDPKLLWYEGGADPVADEELWRSRPDDRHSGRTNANFADGHAERMDVNVLDGRPVAAAPGDNRYYNGHFDSRRR